MTHGSSNVKAQMINQAQNPNDKMTLERGFTLIEILVASALLVGMVVIAVFFAGSLADFRGIFRESLSVQQELQQTLNRIVPEVRSMEPSSTGSYPILDASENSFTFYSDLNKDGLVERVRYFLDGDVFKKGVIVPSGNPLSYDPADETILEMVHNVLSTDNIFSYYDTTYTGGGGSMGFPVEILSIRLVRVSITADQGLNVASGPITLSTQATMRNLRSNL